MTKTLTLLALTTALALPQLAAAQEITEFRIGVLGGENAQERMTNNECLAKHTSETLGVPVRIFTPADYDGVIQGLLGGTLDAAILGASGYAKAYLTNPDAVEPVLVKTNLDGSSEYFSVGFARKDHHITSLADMKGKVLGFGDPNSTSGYLIPAVEMPKQGYSMEPGAYFKDIKFTGGHEQTIVAVNNGDVDAGVTWADGLGNWEDGYNSGALRKAVDAGLVDMNDMVEIWRSEPIPEGPLVVRKALPEDVKAKFTAMMADLINTDKDCTYGVAGGETAGFTPVKHDNYLSIIEARKLEEAKGS
ncbi:phosphonate ABC transporter substrate-binding protein [Paracoccus shanxieyensis]|uniref:Phosphonate ABC transporter substrate-binding protein n=1 Tax=Paracoccus shanxieyensis TaxID=2675752 RepID=A0A6L6IYI6_9RHOB|nr:phosphonate ABC transporter substrate-binding protein [Paracoccus shanxieyensis]MTH65556.1 phosphonate ABC transporter substrate-binding protein [Paracoccus shanxieyensis]MTH88648.1 phosphonate ABC transporter substrate-binding protein [Paracoccus shanxieyensis]